MQAAMRAIVAAVGSVPFVGGVLAAAASAAAEAIYSAVKKTVTNSVRKLGVRVAARLVSDLGERVLQIVSGGDAKDEAVAAAAIAAANGSNTHLEAGDKAYASNSADDAYDIAADAKKDAAEHAKQAEADHKEIANAELAGAGDTKATAPEPAKKVRERR
jgi:hypothetical protein